MREAEVGHLVRREEGRALRLLLVLRRRGAIRGGHGLELERGTGRGERGKLVEGRGWREANYRRREGTGNTAGATAVRKRIAPVATGLVCDDGR